MNAGGATKFVLTIAICTPTESVWGTECIEGNYWLLASRYSTARHMKSPTKNISRLSQRQRDNKRCTWDELVRFLIRRAKGSWGSGNDQWTPGVIATARRLRGGQTSAVMLSATDIKSLREKHNVHLLDEIVAIQPYVTRKHFSGCGLFETRFTRKEPFRGAPVASATYELVQWNEMSTGSGSMQQPEDSHVLSRDSRDNRSGQGRGADEERLSCSAIGSGSRERVYGVLHRVLAATTKDIVNHVEREVSGSVSEY